jgi:hypothetical protein
MQSHLGAPSLKARDHFCQACTLAQQAALAAQR